MIDDDKVSDLLDRAQAEENLYNWTEAVRLYKLAAKSFSDKNKGEAAAIAYKGLGRVYALASETVDTKVEYVESIKGAIEAYNNATNLFKQSKNRAEEIECKAEALFANGFIGSSISEVKKSFSNSSDLFVEASNIFSKNDDQESLARILSRAAFCFSFSQPFLDPHRLPFDYLLNTYILCSTKYFVSL